MNREKLVFLHCRKCVSEGRGTSPRGPKESISVAADNTTGDLIIWCNIHNELVANFLGAVPEHMRDQCTCEVCKRECEATKH